MTKYNQDIDLVTRYTMRPGSSWGTGVLVLNDKGEALVGLRVGEGTWGTPGGRVSPGETAMKGAIRETLEESGLRVKPKYVDVHIGGFGRDKRVWTSFIFIARNFSGKIKPQPSEISEWKWVSLKEMRKLKLFEPTRIMLDILEEHGEIKG